MPTPSPRTIALERLIHPATLDSFTDGGDWTRTQLAHGALDRFPELLEIPELLDLHRLAATYNEPIPVWMPETWLTSKRRRAVYGQRFSPVSALRLHRLGATLFFHHVERFVPALRPILTRLERELGVLGLRSPSVFNVFASAPGAGAVAHFDPEFNFAVQLKGRKRWWFAPNTHIRHPPSGFGVFDTPQTLDPALQLAWPEEPRPTALPEGSEVVDVQEGSTLYFPPGCWHKTQTLEESIHIVMAIWPLSWVDVVRNHIRKSTQTTEAGHPVGSRDSFRDAALRITAGDLVPDRIGDAAATGDR